MKASRILFVMAIAIAALSGCRKHNRPERQNPGTPGENTNPGGQQQQTVFKLEDKSDVWTITYGGREVRNIPDAGECKVEVINVTGVPANTMYLLSVINRANFESYKNDVKAFMEAELKNTAEEYTYQGSQEVLFDPLRHGTWYAFVIKLDSDRKLTGEYAYSKFTVYEEAPTEEFNKWIGNWKIETDSGFKYDLTISSLEANFIYRLDGWETGDKITEQMNMEYLETFFDDGRMYFVSQYIQSYPEDNPTTDEFFFGEVDFDEVVPNVEMGLYVIEDEGLDLGCATMSEDGKSASLQPCKVKAMFGEKEFEKYFFDMLYFYWDYSLAENEQGWTPYNEDVPIFPFTMTRVEAAPTTKAAISLRGFKSEKALRGKVFVPRTQKKAVKLVKR